MSFRFLLLSLLLTILKQSFRATFLQLLITTLEVLELFEMGRLFVIEYDQTPDAKFFLCRTCRTHITLAGNLIYSILPDNEGYFKEAVNLLIDGPEYYRTIGGNTDAVEDVLCTKCLGEVGWKYVEEGTFVLSMDKLLFWNGEQVVDANTADSGNPE